MDFDVMKTESRLSDLEYRFYRTVAVLDSRISALEHGKAFFTDAQIQDLYHYFKDTDFQSVSLEEFTQGLKALFEIDELPF